MGKTINNILENLIGIREKTIDPEGFKREVAQAKSELLEVIKGIVPKKKDYDVVGVDELSPEGQHQILLNGFNQAIDLIHQKIDKVFK